eukprot:3118456-Pyramimonas_sp.AAC.1
MPPAPLLILPVRYTDVERSDRRVCTLVLKKRGEHTREHDIQQEQCVHERSRKGKYRCECA